MIRAASCLFALTVCVACDDIPQVGPPLTEAERSATFPDLLPLDRFRAAEPATQQITTASIQSTQDRLAALRARAARLNRPVVDPATRARMRTAAAQAALR